MERSLNGKGHHRKIADWDKNVHEKSNESKKVPIKIEPCETETHGIHGSVINW